VQVRGLVVGCDDWTRPCACTRSARPWSPCRSPWSPPSSRWRPRNGGTIYVEARRDAKTPAR